MGRPKGSKNKPKDANVGEKRARLPPAALSPEGGIRVRPRKKQKKNDGLAVNLDDNDVSDDHDASENEGGGPIRQENVAREGTKKGKWSHESRVALLRGLQRVSAEMADALATDERYDSRNIKRTVYTAFLDFEVYGEDKKNGKSYKSFCTKVDAIAQDQGDTGETDIPDFVGEVKRLCMELRIPIGNDEGVRIPTFTALGRNREVAVRPNDAVSVASEHDTDDDYEPENNSRGSRNNEGAQDDADLLREADELLANPSSRAGSVSASSSAAPSNVGTRPPSTGNRVPFAPILLAPQGARPAPGPIVPTQTGGSQQARSQIVLHRTASAGGVSRPLSQSAYMRQTPQHAPSARSASSTGIPPSRQYSLPPGVHNSQGELMSSGAVNSRERGRALDFVQRVVGGGDSSGGGTGLVLLNQVVSTLLAWKDEVGRTLDANRIEDRFCGLEEQITAISSMDLLNRVTDLEDQVAGLNRALRRAQGQSEIFE